MWTRAAPLPSERLMLEMQIVSAAPTEREGDSMRFMARSYGNFASRVERWLVLFAHMIVLTAAVAAAGTLPAEAGKVDAAKPIKIVVLGDSLSAGFGLSAADAFPAKLQKALKNKGIDVDMINAGVSGDTASGGHDRLDWSVPEGTDGVILELGANDALRGTDPSVTRAALSD